MRVQIVTLRYSPTLGAIDDRPLRDLQRDREIVSFREHFFLAEGVPHLACVVHWQEAVVPAALHPADSSRPATVHSTKKPTPAGKSRPRENRPAPLDQLDEAGRRLYSTIREWRNDTAHAEGVPHYLVVNNRQALALIEARPESLTAMSSLNGFGPKKVERYGEELLQLLHGTPTGTPPSRRPPTDAEPRDARAEESKPGEDPAPDHAEATSGANSEHARNERPAHEGAAP